MRRIALFTCTLFLALAACCVAVGAYRDTLFLGIVVINALIGIVQELRVKHTLDSIALLEQVARRVAAAGWRLGNLDATVIAQAPKLAGYLPAMRQRLAAACGAPVEAVSVKATTEEHLGFTGQGQGIAAHAVALLEG